MSRHCTANGVTLRPHAKTHKSSAVAREQIRHGARGICCATLAEAELLADSVDSILITSPLVLDAQVSRLVALQSRLDELICVIDNPSVIPRYEQAFGIKRPLTVLLDLDPGMHRTGIDMNEEAFALARSLHDLNAFDFRGVQCYAGNLMHVSDLNEREGRVTQLWKRVSQFQSKLHRQRIPCRVVSGGGTGSYDIDWRAGVLTELQAGSYPFLDLEYANIEWRPDDIPPFEPALFVLTTVVSANTSGHATTDAGLKAFSTDSILPELHFATEYAAKYIFKGDEHGGLVFENPTMHIDIETQLLIVPPHCDPTINLYNQFTVVDAEFRVLDTFNINARSGNSYEGD